MAGGPKDSSAPSRLRIDTAREIAANKIPRCEAARGYRPRALDEFRRELVKTLQRLAFAQTPGPR